MFTSLVPVYRKRSLPLAITLLYILISDRIKCTGLHGGKHIWLRRLCAFNLLRGKYYCAYRCMYMYACILNCESFYDTYWTWWWGILESSFCSSFCCIVVGKRNLSQDKQDTEYLLFVDLLHYNMLCLPSHTKSCHSYINKLPDRILRLIRWQTKCEM